MLSACAGSLAAPRKTAADPVVEQRTITRTLCPPELGLAVPAMPAPAPEAVLRGNDAGLRFHAELGAWGRGLADRLADAAAGCEPVENALSGPGRGAEAQPQFRAGPR